MRKILSILPAAAIIAAALLWPGCGSGDNGKTSNASSAAGAVKTASNTSERFVLDDVFNRKRKWSDFLGKPFAINFWATWCPPCRMEMPALKTLYQEYKPKGLEIIGISVDDTRDPVMPFIQQMKIPWVILYGNQKVAEEFKMGRGIPVTIFFDASGKEIGRVTGAQPESVFRSYFDKMVTPPTGN
jgi:thiol-disulfide isomerase/thioredoxin